MSKKPTSPEPEITKEEAARFRKKLEMRVAAIQANTIPFDKRTLEQQETGKMALLRALERMGDNLEAQGIGEEELQKMLDDTIDEVRREERERKFKELEKKRGDNDGV